MDLKILKKSLKKSKYLQFPLRKVGHQMEVRNSENILYLLDRDHSERRKDWEGYLKMSVPKDFLLRQEFKESQSPFVRSFVRPLDCLVQTLD